jgi:hypothetical protein
MSLAFVSLDLPEVPERGPDALRNHVERELARKGKPVRWAVVQADGAGDSYRVDAVVSVDAPAKAGVAENNLGGELHELPA